MIEKTKNFVTFYYPGAFVGESCTIEIDNRDPEKMFALKEIKSAYGFSFHSVGYINLNNREYKSETFEKTGIFFINGEVFTSRQIKKKYPDDYILLSNIRSNKWKKLVKVNMGWFLPFEKNDSIINR